MVGLESRRRGSLRERVEALLALVGLPANAAERYAHQFSGGQRQRIAIARALAADPTVIVLDEPLSSLDASAQAQIANLLVRLSRELNLALVLISHDLAIVQHIVDEVAVMYLGKLVEQVPSGELWELPAHPYTEALIGAIPRADGERTLPVALAGEVPDPSAPPPGCRFHPRCPYAFDKCRVEEPEQMPIGRGREVACWLHEGASEPKRPGELAAGAGSGRRLRTGRSSAYRRTISAPSPAPAAASERDPSRPPLPSPPSSDAPALRCCSPPPSCARACRASCGAGRRE